MRCHPRRHFSTTCAHRLTRNSRALDLKSTQDAEIRIPRRYVFSYSMIAGAIGLLLGGATGTLSLNGYYHFRHQRLVDPFVTAGYSLFFDRTATSFSLALKRISET